MIGTISWGSVRLQKDQTEPGVCRALQGGGPCLKRQEACEEQGETNTTPGIRLSPPNRYLVRVVDLVDQEAKKTTTYNTGDSPVVTDLSTDPAVTSLFKGERTGSQALWCLWSYVEGRC